MPKMKDLTQRQFYAYLFFVDGVPSYAGKGTKDSHQSNFTGTHPFAQYVRQSLSEGKLVEFTIFECPTEDDAFQKKQQLIAEYGTLAVVTGIKRGPLFNKTIGSRGKVGLPTPEATKSIMSAAKKGKARGPMSQEQKDALRVALTGIKRSDESKAKMAAAKIGTHWTEERRAKASKRKSTDERSDD